MERGRKRKICVCVCEMRERERERERERVGSKLARLVCMSTVAHTCQCVGLQVT